MAVKKYIKLYPAFVSRNLQASMEYKVDFFLGIVANILQQSLGLIFIWVIFSHIPKIEGWGFYQIGLIYGLAAIPSGLAEFFLNTVWNLPSYYINQGNLDRVLIRPLNPLYTIVADGIEPHGLGFVIFGTGMVVYSLIHLHIPFTVLKVIYLIVAALSGAIIYFSINLFMATVAFWFIDVMSTMVMVHHLNEFAKYPLTIYHKAIQILITWVVPFAFTSFYPASYLLDKEAYKNFALITPLVAVIAFAIAYTFWNIGLKKYQSAGG